MPPTLISTTVSTNFAVANSNKNTPSVSWNDGDLITVWGFCGDTSRTLTDPTATGLTFTKLLDSAIASRGQLYLWTATASGASSSVVSSTHSNVEEGGIVVKVYRGASGFGTVSSLGSGTSGAPTVAYTVSAPDSVVDCGWIDWNAVAGARTYLTTNLGAATEEQYYTSGTYATSATWHNAATTATGSQTIGLSAPSATAWLVAGIEIKTIPASVRSTGQFLSSGNVTSGVAPLPTGWQAGDVCYLFCTSRATSGVFGTAPAGWTAVRASFTSSSSTSSYMAVYRRVLVGGDTDPTVNCTSGRLAIASVAVKNADVTGTPEDQVLNDINGAQSASITCPSLTTLALSNDLLLCAFGYGDPTTGNVAQTVTPPGALAENIDICTAEAAATDTGVEVASVLLTSAAATGVQTGTCSASVNGMGVSVAVKSTVGGAAGADNTTKPGVASMFDEALVPGEWF